MVAKSTGEAVEPWVQLNMTSTENLASFVANSLGLTVGSVLANPLPDDITAGAFATVAMSTLLKHMPKEDMLPPDEWKQSFLDDLRRIGTYGEQAAKALEKVPTEQLWEFRNGTLRWMRAVIIASWKDTLARSKELGPRRIARMVHSAAYSAFVVQYVTDPQLTLPLDDFESPMVRIDPAELNEAEIKAIKTVAAFDVLQYLQLEYHQRLIAGEQYPDQLYFKSYADLASKALIHNNSKRRQDQNVRNALHGLTGLRFRFGPDEKTVAILELKELERTKEGQAFMVRLGLPLQADFVREVIAMSKSSARGWRIQRQLIPILKRFAPVPGSHSRTWHPQAVMLPLMLSYMRLHADEAKKHGSVKISTATWERWGKQAGLGNSKTKATDVRDWWLEQEEIEQTGLDTYKLGKRHRRAWESIIEGGMLTLNSKARQKARRLKS